MIRNATEKDVDEIYNIDMKIAANINKVNERFILFILSLSYEVKISGKTLLPSCKI
jgi:hypothetical protein